MPNRPATLDDVAALAQVSGKTVSRVVNGEPNVSAATRERVERAIAELDFSLNRSARSLASARSFLIGAVSQRMTSHYVDEVHRGGAEACRKRGYHLTIEALDPGNESQFAAFARALRHIPFDGVVLLPPVTDHVSLLDLLDEHRVRYVRLAPLRDVGRSDAIFADETSGMDMLVEQLWGLGHRRFGVVGGPPDHLATRMRRDGVFAAVARLGGSADQVVVDPLRFDRDRGITDIPADLAIRVGFESAARLLGQTRPPTAILAFNDDMAAGVIGYARDRGLAVPGDLSVAGFDDATTALVTWPALTTVRQPIVQMAQMAVDWLTGPPEPERREETLPVELVLRDSSGRVRNDAAR